MTLRHFVACLEYRAREHSLEDSERERARRGDPPDPALYSVLHARSLRVLLRELNLDDHAPRTRRPASLVVGVSVFVTDSHQRAASGMRHMAVTRCTIIAPEPFAEIGFN